MNVGEMQRKLSLWATQNKEHRFFDLYHLLYDTDWLRLAHDYVAQNAGSKTAGCDGVDMRFFDENLETNLQGLTQGLKSETFQPHPVRRVHIPKANGRTRALGIHSIRDRIVQEALRMILEPIYEADFSQNSYGFRPNRCTMDAVKRVAASTLGNHTYYWVIEGDLSSYFDTIQHRKLMKIIQRRIADTKIQRLIWKFLRAGVMEGKLFRNTTEGVAQGGIVSPLLANVYLNELDRYMERYTSLSATARRKRRVNRLTNFIYSRYCDDFVVLCNGTKAQAEEMKEELSIFLLSHLRVKLSEEKTKVTHLNDGFKFLGFWIERSLNARRELKTKVLIPKEAMQKFKENICIITAPGTHQDSLNSKILALNRVIGGWCRYYQYTGRASTQFSKLRPFVFWKVAHWIGRKYKISMPEIMKRYYVGNTLATAQYRLMMTNEIKTKIYRPSVIKPNPYLMQKVLLNREELPDDIFWTGYERRPGTEDLRPLVLARDGYVCQICGKTVTPSAYQLDHIIPFRRFKLPVEANHLENLWILCPECHEAKTKAERRMESRDAGKLARPVWKGE
jgi:RNA-directed DNA polymerase